MTDNRIVTGLPYDVDQMIDHIQNEGAIIDPTNIHFDQVEDQISTAFLYLRNTNFDNVTIDWSRVDQQTKVQWAIKYITTPYSYNDPVLNDVIATIVIYNACGKVVGDIVSEQTIIDALKSNQQLFDQLVDFYNSLLLFVIMRTNAFEQSVDWSDVDKIDKPLFGINSYNIIGTRLFDVAVDAFAISDKCAAPKMFSTLFVETNNDLFEKIIRDTVYGATIYAIVEKPDQLKQVADQLFKPNPQSQQ